MQYQKRLQMMIRQDFTDLPPKGFMMQIMDNTAKIYTFLWEKKNDSNKVFFSWEELRKYFNKNTFLTSLRKINSEGLLDYESTIQGVSVELVGWDEVDDE